MNPRFEQPFVGLSHGFNPYPAPKSGKREKPGTNPVPAYPQDSLAQSVQDNPALALVLADKPIVFHRIYLLLMNNCREATRNALILAKLVDLTSSLSPESGGWFEMSSEQWTEFTDSSYTHHLAARKALVEMGFLHEAVPGFRQTKVYRVDSEAIYAAILTLGKTMASERQAAEAAVVRH